MLRQGINAPVTSSMGRLFDAVAAIIGIRQICGFEGQAAMELEFAATPVESAEAHAFELHQAGHGYIVDWEPMLRAIVSEPSSATMVASRFHLTLASMAGEVARRVGEEKVVLSGGCFQNRVLTEAVICHLQQAGFKAYWHQRIPPNDGGISLGQVVAARAELARKAESGR
jgi:hydrogenase maturation protein HypF